MIRNIKYRLSFMLAWIIVSWRRWRSPSGFDPVCSDLQQMYARTSWGKEELDDPLLIDGVTDFSGGQQSFFRSTLIPPNSYQRGQNIIVRDNYEARTRPGADRILGGNAPGIPVVLPSNYANYVSSVALSAATSYILVIGVNEVGGNASATGASGAGTYPMMGIGQSIQFTTTAATSLNLTIVAPASPNQLVTATLIQVGPASCLGLVYFSTPVYEQLLAAFNGNMWVYQGGAWSQSPYTPAQFRLTMAQGVDKLLISDTSGPIVSYDGLTFTPEVTGPGAAPGPNDPPLGSTILCFHQGCMFASGIPPADESSQYPGTAIFADTVLVSNSLAVGKGQWNNLTRSFRIGDGDGEAVLAMASMQDQTLCAFKTNSIWLVNTGNSPNPSQFAANNQIAALSQSIGIVGRDAWCSYSNDIIFMAHDGIRTVQRMQAAAGQWQLSAPLSLPIQDVIQSINWAFAFQIVAKKYQEFAFFFVPTGTSMVNNTVIVYNGRQNCFVGTFSNWNGQEVEVTNFGRLNRFVFGGTQFDVNMWKDYADNTTDSTYMDNGEGYPSVIWTRSFQHNDYVLDKKPNSCILRFSAGNATINASWYGNLSDKQDWSVAPTPSGDILGIGILPFLLSSVAPSKFQKSLRSAPPFNEGFVALSTTGGWFWLRQLWLTAYMNPLKETP